MTISNSEKTVKPHSKTPGGSPKPKRIQQSFPAKLSPECDESDDDDDDGIH